MLVILKNLIFLLLQSCHMPYYYCRTELQLLTTSPLLISVLAAW